MKKVLSIFLSVFIILLSFKPLPVLAYTNNQVVEGHSGTWSGYVIPYNGLGKYFTVSDATGIPTSTYLAPNFFFTNDGETFHAVQGLKMFSYVVNKIVGVVIEPSALNSYFERYLTNTNVLYDGKYRQGCLYDSSDNFLGYCLNDISGCHYDSLPSNDETTVPIPTRIPNNVRNVVDEETPTPDYFVFYPLGNSYILSHLGTTFNATQLENFNSFCENYDFIYGVYSDSSYKTKFYGVYNGEDNYISGLTGVDYLVYTYQVSGNYPNLTWDYFVPRLVEGGELLGSDLLDYNENTRISVVPYDSTGTAITNRVVYQPYNNSTSSQSNILFAISSDFDFMPFNFDSITVFKDNNIKNSLDTQVYQPETFYTNNYYNYDETADNSSSVSVAVLDRSVTNNTKIYDDSSDSFYNYYTNNNYDQSGAVTNVTNITNNYYSSDPDPDPDPDPDNNTLDAILAAILRFFNAIGDIIGTILAGLINMIDAVLESIAGIMEDLDGLTDFFSALVSWLPEPIPSVIGVGVSLCILCAIIGFIRG